MLIQNQKFWLDLNSTVDSAWNESVVNKTHIDWTIYANNSDSDALCESAVNAHQISDKGLK